MAATLYVSGSNNTVLPGLESSRVWLDDAAPYWFLYRYFEAAKLPQAKGELIDLYDSTEISGYQLDRLIEELEFAKADVMAWQAERMILVGWQGDVSQETEKREALLKDDALEVIESILSLARNARNLHFKLISLGD